jgi:NodT family efflux transporter outer membrane factor (OMF) lipoprotein
MPPRSSSLRILSAGCALLLAGCNVPAVTPPLVTEVAPQDLGLGSEPAPPVAEDWWKVFNDPQADRLVVRLLQANPTLQAAMARIRGAEAELAGANSQLSPQVALDGSMQVTRLSDEYILPEPYGGSWRWVSDIQARMRWSLDFWGKQAALIERAGNLAQARRLDVLAARMALAGSFAQAYLGLLVTWQDIDIARQAVEDRRTILDLTRSRADTGLENEAALEQARALLAAAEVDVMAAEADRDLAVHALAALTGQGAAGYADIVRPMANLDSALALPQALPADLLARRPDIAAARVRISAAMRGREAAHADFYPNIDLTAALGFQAVGPGNLFNMGALTTGVAPAIHLPIFDAGKIRAQYDLAGAELDLAIAEYNSAVLAAVRQTADSLSLVRSLGARRERQQAVMDSATRALSLAEERYRLGLSDQLPVLTAEGLLLQARRQMAALNAQLAAQRVALLLSVGGGVDAVALQQAMEQPKEQSSRDHADDK